MKPKSTASAKYTCLISITLALLGIQGCHLENMYEQYEKDGQVTSCKYDLLSLTEGKYIRKLDEDKWVCGDYNHVVLAENPTSSEVCVDNSTNSPPNCCTKEDIRLAAKTMKDKLCPESAHNCVPRVLKDGKLSDKQDMCSEYKDSSINCKKIGLIWHQIPTIVAHVAKSAQVVITPFVQRVHVVPKLVKKRHVPSAKKRPFV